MLFPETHLRVWICTTVTDMRKSFDGLCALTKNVLHQDPLSGHLFVFFNRRKTYVKVLYFEQGGFCLWAKRLEEGQFPVRLDDSEITECSMGKLRLILDGLSEKNFKKSKRMLR